MKRGFAFKALPGTREKLKKKVKRNIKATSSAMLILCKGLGKH